MTLFRVTAPANMPIDLEELKRQITMDLDDDDERLIMALDAAVDELDGANGWLGRALITQTWELRLDRFCDQVKLPLPPLQSVTSIKYIDIDGNEQTLASSVYRVITERTPGLVMLAYQQSWPTIRSEPDAVRIQFVCGYGDSPIDVPPMIRQRLLFRAGFFAEHIDELLAGGSREKTPHVDSMLENFRVR